MRWMHFGAALAILVTGCMPKNTEIKLTAPAGGVPVQVVNPGTGSIPVEVHGTPDSPVQVGLSPQTVDVNLHSDIGQETPVRMQARVSADGPIPALTLEPMSLAISLAGGVPLQVDMTTMDCNRPIPMVVELRSTQSIPMQIVLPPTLPISVQMSNGPFWMAIWILVGLMAVFGGLVVLAVLYSARHTTQITRWIHLHSSIPED